MNKRISNTTRTLIAILILVSGVVIFGTSSCKAPPRKGYINAYGIWVDTQHITIRDTIVQHVKVKQTFENVPYYTAVKTNRFRFIPAVPSDWVNDYSKVLKPSHIKTLDSLIQDHYDTKENQIAVAIIDTLYGKSIEDASRELYEHWYLWKYNSNKSVLVLISVKDRQTVIEVGGGHREYFTMDKSREIIKTEMIPEFRKGRYFEGIRDALNNIIYILNTN